MPRFLRSRTAQRPAPDVPVVCGSGLRSTAIAAVLGLVLALGCGIALAAPPAPATDFTQAEPGEALPGGAATSRKSRNRNAFSHPSANIPFDRLADFTLGNALFRKLWVAAPASTKSSDGLGPLYNARSCQRCHLKDGRGHPPAGNHPDDNGVSMFLRLSIPPQTDEQKAALAAGRISVVPEPTYGGQLQDFAVTGLDGEGFMFIEYTEREVTLANETKVSLRQPRYSVSDLKYGPMHPDTMISPRVAPSMIGLGLLEAIPAADIRDLADPDDSDGDGVSGRTNEVWDGAANALALGRFGWKAGNPSVFQQSAEGFAGDIGIGSHAAPRPWGDCSEAETACRNAVHGNGGTGVEISDKLLDLVVFYARNLAVPQRPEAGEADVLAGKKLFYETGCASCHQPSFVTEERADLPEQSKERIWPYTDMLLHDMGEALADNRPEGRANGREWRTAPLWGIGLTETVNGHTFLLHDGRARNVLEAILWHGGEAEAARRTVEAMSKTERQRLLRFVNSL